MQAVNPWAPPLQRLSGGGMGAKVVAQPVASKQPGGVTTSGFAKELQPQFQQWASSTGPSYTAPTNAQNRFESGLTSAENRLSSLLDDPSSIQQSAAYKFRLGQGEQALQRQQAAKGMLGSGNRLMELTKYGQDMASQEYDNQAQRLQGLLGTYATNWNQNQSANLQNAASVFGTQTQAHSQKGQTLASLLGSVYGSDTQAQIAREKMDANEWEFKPYVGMVNNRTGEIRPGQGSGGGISTRWG